MESVFVLDFLTWWRHPVLGDLCLDRPGWFLLTQCGVGGPGPRCLPLPPMAGSRPSVMMLDFRPRSSLWRIPRKSAAQSAIAKRGPDGARAVWVRSRSLVAWSSIVLGVVTKYAASRLVVAGKLARFGTHRPQKRKT